jgi:hypothetical protein
MKILFSVFLLLVVTFSVPSQESNAEKKEKKTMDTTSVKKHQVNKNSEKPIEESGDEKNEVKKNVPISFSKEIFPLLQKHCMPCHSEEEENPSELYFQSYETLMKGGKNGAPIISGKGDSSMFVKKLRPKPAFGDQMPLPKRKPKLSEEIIQIFIDWMNQGAKKN